MSQVNLSFTYDDVKDYLIQKAQALGFKMPEDTRSIWCQRDDNGLKLTWSVKEQK